MSYLGTHYFGWQKTKSGPSIQETLEDACARILQERSVCEAASRTDRGVHAKGQIVQFYTAKEMPLGRLQRGLNAVLPPDIRVLEAEYLEFHPTLDALCKTYHYDLCLGRVQDPFFRDLSWHYPYKIDESAIRQAAAELTGTHDFSAFTTENKKNPVCTLSKIEFIPLGNNRLRMALTGDRFLYKMARTIAGTLANIGSGKLPFLPGILNTYWFHLKDPDIPRRRPRFEPGVDGVEAAKLKKFSDAGGLEACGCPTPGDLGLSGGTSIARAQTGVTAPPHGLTLYKVYY